MQSNSLYQSILKREKKDLHVHFEGTVSAQTLQKLALRNDTDIYAQPDIAKRNNIPAPRIDKEGNYQIENFEDFISIYLKISETIQTAEDVILIGTDYLESTKAQNITYSEIYFTPTTFASLGIPIEELFDGLREVEQIARERFGTEISWIFDIVCNVQEYGMETIELALQARERGVSVCAIALAGFEARSYPPTNFVAAFERARSLGLRTLAHAGETGDAKHMSEIVHQLKPERIGHGIAALDDPALVQHLVDQQTLIEVSPWSNILLGITTEKEHPVKKMVDVGLNVIICSDDPGILGKSLMDNYQYALEQGIEL